MSAASYEPSPQVQEIMGCVAWPKRGQFDPERINRDMLDAQSHLIKLYLELMDNDTARRACATLRWISDEMAATPTKAGPTHTG